MAIIKKIWFLFFLSFLVVFSSRYWLPTKINKIYPFEMNEKKAIVLLDNPPLTETTAFSFWEDNRLKIISMLGGMKTADYVLFLENKLEKKSKSENEQICISSLDSANNSCVNLNDRLFFVERKPNGFWIGFYEVYGLNTCIVFAKDDGEKEYFNCEKDK